MPEIDQDAAVTENAKRLIEMATLVTIPIVFTEQRTKFQRSEGEGQRTPAAKGQYSCRPTP
jgi:hypothetical protein